MNKILLLIFIFFLISCEKEQSEETNILENFSIVDIHGINYNLDNSFANSDYLLLFGFATWCHWSQKSIPIINSIDSLYSRKILVIAVEDSTYKNELSLNQFIEDYNFHVPIVIRNDNTVLNYILYPDSILAFPSFVLINSKRKIIYRQSGYLESTLDSITKHIK
jgi:hypothetical protein